MIYTLLGIMYIKAFSIKPLGFMHWHLSTLAGGTVPRVGPLLPVAVRESW